MNMSCTMSGVPRMNSMYATASQRSGAMRPMRMVAMTVPRSVPRSTEKAAIISVFTMPSVKKLL